MKLAKIERVDEKKYTTLYMFQDLSDLQGYDRAKAIVDFCDKETKLFEKEIDRAILEIFDRNGIEIPSTDKSALKLAFDLLKAKRKDIVVENASEELFNCKKIKEDKRFCVYIEDNRYIQCCVRVKEEIIND